MSGDAVATSAVGMGMPRVVTQMVFRGDPCEETQHPRKYLARECVPGYQREVLPCSSRPCIRADSCLLKGRDGASHVGQVQLSFVHQVPTVPSKHTHTRDRMQG